MGAKNIFQNYFLGLIWGAIKKAQQQNRAFILSGRRVSNPLPAAWKAAALPNELLPQGLRPFRNLCGGGWTRTTELRRGQIYSLLQLPLCDSPKFYEPIDGLEPPTGWLQISCSTNWAISAWDCVCLSNNVPRFWGCKNTLFSYSASHFQKNFLAFLKHWFENI